MHNATREENNYPSRFIENTAAEKVQFLTNKLLGYREEQKKIFNSSPDMTLGDVTTVNLTYMSGGVQMNVVPNEFTIGFDIRITPTTKLEKFEAMIDKAIRSRLEDGQLDECPLTMEDLQKIKGRRDGKHGLLPVLSGLYHSRPEYPSKDDE